MDAPLSFNKVLASSVFIFQSMCRPVSLKTLRTWNQNGHASINPKHTKLITALKAAFEKGEEDDLKMKLATREEIFFRRTWSRVNVWNIEIDSLVI